jgi:NAD+-dependent secondary alcohol dehydrogenase Adh1
MTLHALASSFSGINANGGYAEYLLTGPRSFIKIPETLAPKDVAPYTDAGLTAYRAAGLGHIGIQVLAALCAPQIIVVDRAEKLLELAKKCGAHHLVKAGDNEVEAVMALPDGPAPKPSFISSGKAMRSPRACR